MRGVIVLFELGSERSREIEAFSKAHHKYYKVISLTKNMGKLNQLLGVADNLASSFVSIMNHRFLDHMESLPIEKTSLFEVDILEETIKPEDLMSKTVEDTIAKYKKWFLVI